MPEEAIRAKSFEVVDDEGNLRGRIGAESSGDVGIQLFDANGITRVLLAVNRFGTPQFGHFDENGTARVDITSGIDGQIVRLNDEDGDPRAMMALLTEQGSAPAVTFMDKEENARVQLQLTHTGIAVIAFNDENGELQVALGRDDEGESMLLYRDAQGNQTRVF